MGGVNLHFNSLAEDSRESACAAGEALGNTRPPRRKQGALVGALGPRQLGAALDASDRLSAHSTAVGHLRDKSRAPDSAVKRSAFSVVLSEPRAGKGFLCFIFLTSPVPPAPSVAPVLPACPAAVVCRRRLTVGEVDGPRRLRTPLAVRKHAQTRG